ncbi:MAG: hypothetical protein KatS3mg076_1956 [Candidatus Binatia bacterium]|nr:MAG: hypothetical protein KatS3mg076_1956 [Candidatus Binatia bacterium]
MPTSGLHSSLPSVLENHRKKLEATARSIDERFEEIQRHARRVSPRRFRQFLSRLRLAAELLLDLKRGEYRKLPWATASALGLALAYFLLPADFIPDFVPFSGFVDDALVLGLVFAGAEADLRAYCRHRGLDESEYF